ncbi:MAG: PP2C family protein-serine/threonine phosphatase, partial [Eubacterium sp.]
MSGKGIPAALLMMKTKTLIADHAAHAETPAQALEQVNKILCKNNEESMFVTAFLGILDTESGVLTYSNAGHNPPL